MEFVTTEQPCDEDVARIISFPRGAARRQRRLGQRLRRLVARFKASPQQQLGSSYGGLELYRPEAGGASSATEGNAARQL